MSGIVFAGLSPHPPVAVPEIGRSRLNEIEDTRTAMKELASKVKESNPDLVITISPHGPVFSDAISILNLEELKGDFGQFGLPEIELSYGLQEDVVEELVRVTKLEDSTGGRIEVARIDEQTARKFEIDPKLDHGALVPLYYLAEASLENLPLVPITMGMLPYEDLYEFGKIIQLIAVKLDYDIAVIASGDLSHRLTPDAPAGFNPQAEEFDQQLIKALEKDRVEDIFELDQDLIEKAGECGLRPIIIMLGALDGLAVEPELLSYEGPFGVGYGVVSYKINGEDKSRKRLDDLLDKRQARLEKQKAEESELVKLARKTIEEYALNREVIDSPQELPPEMEAKRGVFVSIKKHGQLRGCIGTTAPTEDNVAEEIIRNALHAGFKDPRFEEIDINELEDLTYSVDVLEEPKPVDTLDELDPQEYGVIVQKGQQTGLLLPNLEGVETVEKQLEIAKRKAGLSPTEEDVELKRFKVTRYK
ncbi:AmmeMemoRadiSam system protein A [Acetohalobium arabaticum]|uniref:AMMECR1 domain protein n=1 Tax=Acetohalobium arabaticum (strain ATCC 49924 / DSM 5501 / Z-7288) TaxID=574087 RepID=D9QTI5_ACEAZ|nr:AmmeMemoRadiSam system protein A [Acetohalobium arabaticum]ADL11749.1 AMMECR1 domain protein [Acetohalobium arabaticum DSM 5501]